MAPLNLGSTFLYEGIWAGDVLEACNATRFKSPESSSLTGDPVSIGKVSVNIIRACKMITQISTLLPFSCYKIKHFVMELTFTYSV